MGEIQLIRKSRKEQRCGMCGAIIPVGSSYYIKEAKAWVEKYLDADIYEELFGVAEE